MIGTRRKQQQSSGRQPTTIQPRPTPDVLDIFDGDNALASFVHLPLFDPSTAFFSALLQNALHLDLDLTCLAACKDTYTSPFYKPLTAQSTLPVSEHAHLPASLRPTPAQVLIPHHASFDLIPIPAFRERAIMLSAAMPHVFNLKELKIDIHVRGGMEIAKGEYTWDEKSWKVKPWFLDKWCMLVK